MVFVLCLRLVNNNDVGMFGSLRFAEGVLEVLHALFKRRLERGNVEDVVFNLVPARGIGAADNGDCFLELATTSEEFTVEPNISGEA